jgi:hypothetical protein
MRCGAQVISTNFDKDWSYMAMNSTYRALTKAGFNRENFPNLQDVMFITEPEAAALYTARHYRDEMSQEFLEVYYMSSSVVNLLETDYTNQRKDNTSYSVTLAVVQW